MATHKAYILSSFTSPLNLQTVPTPTPTSGQVLVRVLSTPILSYASLVLDGSIGFPLALPLSPGTSAIARVLATGSDATSLTEGQLCFCAPIIRARDDVSGQTSMLHGWNGGASAASLKLMEGTWRDGSWAEKMIVPMENVVALDEGRLVGKVGGGGGLGYSVEQLTWINELLVAFGPLEAAGFAVGSTIIVAPATGHFGGSVVRLALALGAGTVVAAARGKEKLLALTKLSSGSSAGRVKTVAFSGDVEADAKALKKATPQGKGADVYIDFSPFQAGSSKHPLACISALKSGGTAIMSGGVQSDLSINYAQLMFGNLTIRGNFMYKASVPAKLVGLVESGVISLDGCGVEVFDFEKITDGIKASPEVESFEKMVVLTPNKA